MERREMYLLASRAACTVLAVGSFAIGPPLSRSTLVAEAFVAVKATALWAMLMCPVLMMFHVAEIRQWQWLQAAPGDHFSYPVVFFEWAFAAVYWGSASAPWGILIDHHFRRTCSSQHQVICRRYEIACALSLLLGALATANAAVVHRARNRSNGPRLLVLLFGP